ncbi:MAG: hypothetical protein US31_C0019G0003 [Berkelbacteria bacterium GW2011_GWA1_36_9]|uniref:GIY-YIG domain-containing protein n=1 Tax=Berkelbacteria bacterium GW2011_GWA1_36_9 TaxID=1618331 RepID=A0A0G0IN06_9BACT|nr:MAG: hypothetical protein US31_C0019G0003 [Berkelbacteria bacterium GW2011_GWA1_36_9]
MTNHANTVIYVGITNNLQKRVFEHKNKITYGFTSKYNIDKLVRYEIFQDPISAITREKQIKGGSRRKKLELIAKDNPNFEDLYSKIL